MTPCIVPVSATGVASDDVAPERGRAHGLLGLQQRPARARLFLLLVAGVRPLRPGCPQSLLRRTFG